MMNVTFDKESERNYALRGSEINCIGETAARALQAIGTNDEFFCDNKEQLLCDLAFITLWCDEAKPI